MSTIKIKIGGDDDAYNSRDCKCMETLQPHNPVEIIRQKSNKPTVKAVDYVDTSSSSSSMSVERTRSTSRRRRVCKRCGKKKLNCKCKRCGSAAAVAAKRGGAERRKQLEFKLYELIMGSALTFSLWLCLKRPETSLAYQMISSAFMLLLVICFKYGRSLFDAKFWECLISNTGCLIQAYCAMLSICVLICMLNNFLATVFTLTSAYIAAFLIISILYLQLRLNDRKDE